MYPLPWSLIKDVNLMAIRTVNSDVYIRVERPRIYGKYTVIFDLVEYIYHPISSKKIESSRSSIECNYNLQGGNVFEQCYEEAKRVTDIEVVDC